MGSNKEKDTTYAHANTPPKTQAGGQAKKRARTQETQKGCEKDEQQLYFVGVVPARVAEVQESCEGACALAYPCALVSLCAFPLFSSCRSLSAVREAGRDADARLAKEIDRSTPLSPTSLSSVLFLLSSSPPRFPLPCLGIQEQADSRAERERVGEHAGVRTVCKRESESHASRAHRTNKTSRGKTKSSCKTW